MISDKSDRSSDVSETLSGGRPGGCKILGDGVCLRVLARTLRCLGAAGEELHSGEARCACARGFACLLGRACSAQVRGGSFRFLEKS